MGKLFLVFSSRLTVDPLSLLSDINGNVPLIDFAGGKAL